MGFKIGLLGLGTVGTGTAQILLDPVQRHPLVQELELYRVGVRSHHIQHEFINPKIAQRIAMVGHRRRTGVSGIGALHSRSAKSLLLFVLASHGSGNLYRSRNPLFAVV